MCGDVANLYMTITNCHVFSYVIKYCCSNIVNGTMSNNGVYVTYNKSPRRNVQWALLIELRIIQIKTIKVSIICVINTLHASGSGPAKTAPRRKIRVLELR